MFKENLNNNLLAFIICILISLLIFVLISGCKSIPMWNNKPIQTNPSSTPTDQLWDAVKKSNWLITFSILGIATGFFAFLNGSKMGLPAIGASCISLFMALAVARFATWMAICGLIGSCAAVGISILVKNKAFKDIICNVEKIKDIAKENGNTVSQPMIKAALTDQSKSTRKLVQKVKSNLKLKNLI